MIYSIIITVFFAVLLFVYFLPVIEFFETAYKHGHLTGSLYYFFVIITILICFTSSLVFACFVIGFLNISIFLS